MPKASDPFAKRKEVMSNVLAAKLIERKMNGVALGRRKIMPQSTYYKRHDFPETVTFEEIWRMDDALKFTNAEILRMFGREES